MNTRQVTRWRFVCFGCCSMKLWCFKIPCKVLCLYDYVMIYICCWMPLVVFSWWLNDVQTWEEFPYWTWIGNWENRVQTLVQFWLFNLRYRPQLSLNQSIKWCTGIICNFFQVLYLGSTYTRSRKRLSASVIRKLVPKSWPIF